MGRTSQHKPRAEETTVGILRKANLPFPAAPMHALLVVPLMRSKLTLLLCLIIGLVSSNGISHAATVDVAKYGATGNGVTVDSDAINAAIVAANQAGGGTVYFPAGRYLCFSLRLKSRVSLYLDAGATIIAAEPPAGLSRGYDAPEPSAWSHFQDFGHTHWHNSLIWGEDLTDISILGPGTIFGCGLSKGKGIRDLLPEEKRAGTKVNREIPASAKMESVVPGPFGYPTTGDVLPAGIGNKAIALKNCRNVILRDFTIYHGGHFGLLATAVDNLTVDNLKIDTNRDGMDIDCCRNVRISNCTVNSPIDDGICLKSSYGLGQKRGCDNITITNCQVSGYDEGTLLDGTYRRTPSMAAAQGPMGRIKLGTESNGSFRNITISNCVFDYCRGLALETVDGADLEDITVSNLTMRDIVNAPIFIRLGTRLRGPDQPAAGVCRRIRIQNVVANTIVPQSAMLIMGVPGHTVEDVTVSDITVNYAGGGTREHARHSVPELEKDYPEPARFGDFPSYGLFARHVKNLRLHDIELRCSGEDLRPAVIIDDVAGVTMDRMTLTVATATSRIVAKQVSGLQLRNISGVADVSSTATIVGEQW